MASRNNSSDAPISLQQKLICLRGELKKAQSLIIQQQHMLQVQKQLMDRKQSIDKVKNTLVANLKQENSSLLNQISILEKNNKEKSSEIEKLGLINKNLKAANDQLLVEISKQQSGPSADEKEIRIQQIKRLSIIDARPPPPPPLPLPTQKIKEQSEQYRVKPKRPLKQLHLEPVLPQKIEKTFWGKLDDLSIQLNYEQIEELFYQQQSQGNSQQPQQLLLQQIQLTQTSNIQILNQERSRAVELVIAKYRLNSQLVIRAVSNIDLEFLNTEKIEALTKCLPQGKETEQLEKAKISNIQGKFNVPEKFLIDLYGLPYFEERLSSINFKMNFQDIQKSIDAKLILLQNVCQDLINNTELQRFLLCCLALGNFLNVNTPKGIIKGFKLESIEKYHLIKGNDRETSLLMYLIELAEKEKIIIFTDDENDDQLLNTSITTLVAEASKFSLIQVFNNEINQIKTGIKHLQLMFTIDDKFINEAYTNFLSEVKDYFSKTENQYLETQKGYEKLCDCYGESYQNYESEKVFTKFNQLYFAVRRAKQQLSIMKISHVNEQKVRETQTQLERVRQSIIATPMNDLQQQVENAKRLPLNQLLKLKKKTQMLLQEKK